MNRPFLFAGDFTPSCGKHPFSEMQKIKEARKHLLNNRNTNIFFLLKKRYSWMNKYINEFDNGIEI